MTATNTPPPRLELGADGGALGLDLLEKRLGSGVRDIERVEQERAQRKGWAELHRLLDERLSGRPDVTVGDVMKRKEG